MQKKLREILSKLVAGESLADEDLGRLNVTFNLTIDLQDARAAGLIRSNDRD